MPQAEQFPVLIIGAGVAGLTLSHALSNANIPSLVLESKSLQDTENGTSIGIFPNGGLGLHQLGVFGDVLASAQPVQRAFLWSEGVLLRERKYPDVVTQRMGYPYLFLRRGELLRILRPRLPLSSRIIFSKRVLSVEPGAMTTTVRCTDGSIYQAAIAVGADGPGSIVRRAILKTSLVQDQVRPTCEYSCVFGISSAHEALPPGTLHNTYGKDYAMTCVCNGRETFWTVYLKGSPLKGMPAGKALAPLVGKCVAFDIRLRALVDSASTMSYFPLDEILCSEWTKGRLVCLGDAVHKMVPNLGQGGNLAIEDAITLSETLRLLFSVDASAHSSQGPGLESSPIGKGLSVHDIETILKEWQNSRLHRCQDIWTQSHYLMRLETFATPRHYIVGQFLMPFLDMYLADTQCQLMDPQGAQRLPFWRPLASLIGDVVQGLGPGWMVFYLVVWDWFFHTSTNAQ